MVVEGWRARKESLGLVGGGSELCGGGGGVESQKKESLRLVGGGVELHGGGGGWRARKKSHWDLQHV